MATITLQKRNIAVPHDSKNKRNKGRTIILNVYTILFVLILMIVGTCFLYLSKFNDIASQGVIINDLERTRSRLIIENEVWNMRIAQLKSMDVIEKQDVVKRMRTIDPSEIEFMNLDQPPR